jgi:hypothetical protein
MFTKGGQRGEFETQKQEKREKKKIGITSGNKCFHETFSYR